MTGKLLDISQTPPNLPDLSGGTGDEGSATGMRRATDHTNAIFSSGKLLETSLKRPGVRNLGHIADDVLVGPKVRYVKLSGAPLRRGSGFGAFHPLTRVPSKVASANTLGTLRLGRGNWSSCPTAAVEEQLSGRVIALKHSVGRLR